MVARRQRSPGRRGQAEHAVDHETFSRAIDVMMRLLNDHLLECEADRESAAKWLVTLNDLERLRDEQSKRFAELETEINSLKEALARRTDS